MILLRKKEIVTFTLLLFSVTFAFSQQRGSDNDDRPSGPPPSTEEIFKRLDSNEDDKISLKEVKGPLKNDFSKIDANEDGFITKKELENAPKPDNKRRQE